MMTEEQTKSWILNKWVLQHSENSSWFYNEPEFKEGSLWLLMNPCKPEIWREVWIDRFRLMEIEYYGNEEVCLYIDTKLALNFDI